MDQTNTNYGTASAPPVNVTGSEDVEGQQVSDAVQSTPAVQPIDTLLAQGDSIASSTLEGTSQASIIANGTETTLASELTSALKEQGSPKGSLVAGGEVADSTSNRAPGDTARAVQEEGKVDGSSMQASTQTDSLGGAMVPPSSETVALADPQSVSELPPAEQPAGALVGSARRSASPSGGGVEGRGQSRESALGQSGSDADSRKDQGQHLRLDIKSIPAPAPEAHRFRSPSESSEEEGMLRIDETGRLIDEDMSIEAAPAAVPSAPLHASFLPMIDPSSDATPSNSSPAPASASSHAAAPDYRSRQASYHDGSASPMPPRSAGWDRDYRRDRDYPPASRHDRRDIGDRDSRDAGWGDRSYVAPSVPRERMWSGDFRGDTGRSSRPPQHSPLERHFSDRDREWERDHYSPGRGMMGGRERDVRSATRGSAWSDRDRERTEARRMRDDDRFHPRPSPVTDIPLDRPSREFSPRRRWGSPANAAVPSPTTVRSPGASGSSAPSGSRPMSPAHSTHSRRTSSSQHAGSPFAHNNGRGSEIDFESVRAKRAASEEHQRDAGADAQRAKMGWLSPRATEGQASQGGRARPSVSKPTSPARRVSTNVDLSLAPERHPATTTSSISAVQAELVDGQSHTAHSTTASALDSHGPRRSVTHPTFSHSLTTLQDDYPAPASTGADDGTIVNGVPTPPDADEPMHDQPTLHASPVAPPRPADIVLDAPTSDSVGPQGAIVDEMQLSTSGLSTQGSVKPGASTGDDNMGDAIDPPLEASLKVEVDQQPSSLAPEADIAAPLEIMSANTVAPYAGSTASRHVDKTALDGLPLSAIDEPIASSLPEEIVSNEIHMLMAADPPIEAALVKDSPVIFPVSQDDREKILRAATRRIAQRQCLNESDLSALISANLKLAELTTFDVLESPVYGPPETKNDNLWLDGDDPDLTLMKRRLTNHLTSREQRLAKKVEALREQYKTISDEWDGHCQRLDRIKERTEALKRQSQPNGPMTPTLGAGSGPAVSAVDDGISTVGMLAPGTSRHNRRSMQSGFASFGDAVRSEAEFLEILASLETADMQDPNMRAARTTVAVPDMIIDPDSSRLCQSEVDDTNGYVADPISFYLSDLSADHWTEEEQVLFEKRYILFPKQFGRIAAGIPDKSPSQCVVYYYNNKKNPNCDFKTLAAARSRDRKKKSRVKPRKAKGSALIADLKVSNGDDGDDAPVDGELPPRKRTRPSMSGRVDSSLSRLDEEEEGDVRSGTKRRADDGDEVAERRTRTKSAKRPKNERKSSAAAGDLASQSTSVQSHSGMATPIGFMDSAAADLASPLSGISGVSAAEMLAKASKKRKSTNEDGSIKRSRATTSSYWSIAERNEFLRSLIINGKDWNSIATSLSTKSAAQARNFFTRNAEEAVFAEAAILATDNANESLEIRQDAASTFTKRMLSGDDPSAGVSNESMRIVSEEPSGSRGLKINSLLNEEPSQDRERKRPSLQDWFGSSRSDIDDRTVSPPPRDLDRERERDIERARQLEQLRDRNRASHDIPIPRRDNSISDSPERERREYVDVREAPQRNQWMHQTQQQQGYGVRRSSLTSPVLASMPPPSSSYHQAGSARERPAAYQYAVPSHSHYSERSSMDTGSNLTSQHMPMSRRSPDRTVPPDQRYGAMNNGQSPRPGAYEQRSSWSSNPSIVSSSVSHPPPHRYSSPMSQPLSSQPIGSPVPPSPYGTQSRQPRTSSSPAGAYERSSGSSLGSYSPYSQQPPQSTVSAAYGSMPIRERFAGYTSRPSGLGSLPPPQLPPPSRSASASPAAGYGSSGMSWSSHHNISPNPQHRSPTHRPPPSS